MGWIRRSDLRVLEQHHSVPCDETKTDKVEVEHVEIVPSYEGGRKANGTSPESDGEDVTTANQIFPIVPRRCTESDLPFIAADEVSKRDGQGSNRLWIIVDGLILDCTEYRSRHPGGRMIIEGFGGQDASWQWWSFHGKEIWKSVAMGLRVGRTDGVEDKHVKPAQFVGLRKFGFQEE